MEVLASDIMGIFEGDDGHFVRIKRPDFTFVEGDIAPEHVTEFSGRLQAARKNDPRGEFDVSMLTNLREAD